MDKSQLANQAAWIPRPPYAKRQTEFAAIEEQPSTAWLSFLLGHLQLPE